MNLFVNNFIFNMCSSVEKFSQFATSILQKSIPLVILPQFEKNDLFDFTIDGKSGQFCSWNDISKERPRNNQLQHTFVSEPEVNWNYNQ